MSRNRHVLENALAHPIPRPHILSDWHTQWLHSCQSLLGVFEIKEMSDREQHALTTIVTRFMM